MEAVGSYEELRQKPGATGFDVWENAKAANPSLADHLRIHKPYIDAVTYDSPQAPGKRMRRVGDVIDCWFDSGAMPFAQWGYPNKEGSGDRFWKQFPADFISEAIDQTRGWFYSQLAISTLLFGRDSGTQMHGSLTREERARLRAFVTRYGERRRDITRGSHLTAAYFEPYPHDRGDLPAGYPNLADTSFELYPHPFRNCIVLGLMLGEDGQKMSKSKRNYREPREIFDKYGADALRWYFFANQPPWTSIRYSEQAIKETIPEFLLRLWNVYSFFVIYANIDGFDPAKEIVAPACQLGPDVLATALTYRPPRWRSELDRWILSELNRTAAAVVQRMDQYDNFNACERLIAFVDALSNWYVRRSRDRFWSSVHDADKSDGYWTLYECLLTTAKLIAPFVPFLAEELWQNLAVAAFRNYRASKRPVESVHLCDYPTGHQALIDEALSDRMALVREIVSLGLSARMGAKLKVRQPLSKVEVVLADRTHLAWLEEHAALICGELNVKKVEFAERADHYITYTILPDLKRLGPRLGKRLPVVKKLLAETDGGALLAELKARGQVTFILSDGPVVLDADDIQVRLQAKEGWAAAQGKACVVVLATELTEDLLREGLAREVARAVNDRRKEMGCQFTDRVELAIVTDSAELHAAIEQYREYIMAETLAVSIVFEPIAGVEPVTVEIGDYRTELYVKVL